MRRPYKILFWFLVAGSACAVLAILAAVIAWFVVTPNLPPASTLNKVQLQVPMRVLTRDGKLMAEYGVKRRIPLQYKDIPPLMVDAFVAAEDNRYFRHPGVDAYGLLRAAISLVMTGKKKQGGSTITMQVARNFFLSPKKTYLRKLREIFLSLKIDHYYSKEEILTLYLNKIYLGQRSFGVGAAAQTYFGTDVWHLTLAQIAMIAGLPRAPSLDNPVHSPDNARIRRNYVLYRMLKNGFIDQSAYQRAKAQPITGSYHGEQVRVSAPYVAEMVRDKMVARYGESAYTDGFSVTTTIDSRLQPLAVRALRTNLENYSYRHGYRGPQAHIDLAPDMTQKQWRKAMAKYHSYGNLSVALVIHVGKQSIKAYVPDDAGRVIYIDWKGLSWTQPFLSVNSQGKKPTQASDSFSVGDVIYVVRHNGHWRVSQVPRVEGALVSLDPIDGAIVALAGGFDFNLSKFNRVTQARRQPGSSFKPFIYTAALAHGMTPATTINDAPVVVADDPSLDNVWRPENYEHRFRGPTRLRIGLVHSLNLVSIRVLRRVGIDFTLKYMSRFGFNASKLPHYLSLALGSASVTPLQMARGYAVIANGGYLVKPYLIQKVTDSNTGQVLYQANPATVCRVCGAQKAHAPQTQTQKSAFLEHANAHPDVKAEGVSMTPAPASVAATATAQHPKQSMPAPKIAPRTIAPIDDYQIQSMMRDVIHHGTGRRAQRIGRHDLAGKTGTTNDWRNAWFGGFNANLVTFTYTGFDHVHSLGRPETGARAALPAWIDFMGPALADTPPMAFTQPPGMVTVRINSKTGQRTGPGDPDAIFETFRADRVPGDNTPSSAASQP